MDVGQRSPIRTRLSLPKVNPYSISNLEIPRHKKKLAPLFSSGFRIHARMARILADLTYPECCTDGFDDDVYDVVVDDDHALVDVDVPLEKRM